MRNKNMLGGFIAGTVFIILQSTLFRKLGIDGILPDFALIIIVFTANSLGAFKGQILGFGCGIVQDLLSVSPPGYNALVYLISGFLFGKMKGKLFLDALFLPVIFIVSATLIKELTGLLVSSLFLPDGTVALFGKAFLIELGLNAFAAPFIFALLKLAGIYRLNERDDF